MRSISETVEWISLVFMVLDGDSEVEKVDSEAKDRCWITNYIWSTSSLMMRIDAKSKVRRIRIELRNFVKLCVSNCDRGSI